MSKPSENTDIRCELHPFFDDLKCINTTKYIGTCAYANLNQGTRLKAEFQYTSNSDIFTHLRLIVINKAYGEVDRVSIPFPATATHRDKPGCKHLRRSTDDNTLTWSDQLTAEEIDDIRHQIADFIFLYI